MQIVYYQDTMFVPYKAMVPWKMQMVYNYMYQDMLHIRLWYFEQQVVLKTCCLLSVGTLNNANSILSR